MLHLLPESYIEEVRKEYRRRSLVVVFNLISFILFVFILGCIPSLIITSSEKSDIERQYSKSSFKISDEDKKTALVFESAVKRGVEAARDSMSISSKDIGYVLSYTRSGIILNSVSIRTEGNVEQVDLYGTADTRADLSSFIKTIDADGKYKVDDVPASTFTRDKNIVFTLVLKKHNNTSSQ